MTTRLATVLGDRNSSPVQCCCSLTLSYYVERECREWRSEKFFRSWMPGSLLHLRISLQISPYLLSSGPCQLARQDYQLGVCIARLNCWLCQPHPILKHSKPSWVFQPTECDNLEVLKTCISLILTLNTLPFHSEILTIKSKRSANNSLYRVMFETDNVELQFHNWNLKKILIHKFSGSCLL